MRKEIDHHLSSSVPFLSMSGSKRKPKKADQRSGKYPKNSVDDDITKAKKKKLDKKKGHGGSENAGAAVKKQKT